MDSSVDLVAEPASKPSHNGSYLLGAAIRGRVQQLSPILRERAHEIEAQRRMPRDIVEKLRSTGVFRMNVPRSFGGPELSTLEQVSVLEELATADASVAWCAMIGCDSGIFRAYLEERTARALYPRLDMIQAGWLFPAGRAHRVPGGFRVSGEFKFGSGSTHADVMDAGCHVFEDGKPVIDGGTGQPIWRIMLARPCDFELEDDWHTTGLKGSGSVSYRCRDLFVPEEHSFSFHDRPRIDAPLYRRNDTLLRKMVAIPLGLMRAAIDEALEIFERKLQYPARRPYKNIPAVPEAVGRAAALHAAARAYAYDALERQWESIERGREPTKSERAHVWLSRTSAFQTARDVTRLLYDAVGAEAIYATHTRMDRLLRDATTMAQHVVGQDKGWRMAGRLLLGDEAEYPLL
jgi:alkylation response protein AidB-like acyl-CoA dehydrogenase